MSLDDTTYIANLNSLTRLRIESNILQILDRLTELTVVAHQDIVLLTVLTVVRSNCAIYSVTKICCSCCHIQAIASQLIAIKYHLILRSVLVTRDCNLGTTLNIQHLLLNFGSDTVGRVKIVSIEFDIHRLLTSGSTLLSRLDNLEGSDLGILLQILTHQVANLRQ